MLLEDKYQRHDGYHAQADYLLKAAHPDMLYSKCFFISTVLSVISSS